MVKLATVNCVFIAGRTVDHPDHHATQHLNAEAPSRDLGEDSGFRVATRLPRSAVRSRPLQRRVWRPTPQRRGPSARPCCRRGWPPSDPCCAPATRAARPQSCVRGSDDLTLFCPKISQTSKLNQSIRVVKIDDCYTIRPLKTTPGITVD